MAKRSVTILLCLVFPSALLVAGICLWQSSRAERLSSHGYRIAHLTYQPTGILWASPDRLAVFREKDGHETGSLITASELAPSGKRLMEPIPGDADDWMDQHSSMSQVDQCQDDSSVTVVNGHRGMPHTLETECGKKITVHVPAQGILLACSASEPSGRLACILLFPGCSSAERWYLRHIAHTRKLPMSLELWQSGTNGTSLQRLAVLQHNVVSLWDSDMSVDCFDLQLSWSPDERRLAMLWQGDLWVLNAVNPKFTPVKPGPGSKPAASMQSERKHTKPAISPAERRELERLQAALESKLKQANLPLQQMRGKLPTLPPEVQEPRQ